MVRFLGGLPFSLWMTECKLLVAPGCRERSVNRKRKLKLHLGITDCDTETRKVYTVCLHIIRRLGKKLSFGFGFCVQFYI